MRKSISNIYHGDHIPHNSEKRIHSHTIKLIIIMKTLIYPNTSEIFNKSYHKLETLFVFRNRIHRLERDWNSFLCIGSPKLQ